MKNSVVVAFLIAFSTVKSFSQDSLILWYDKPAAEWDDALPIGNGRLGAMVFGRTTEELIQLNEATLWTGGPVDLNPNPEAPKYLPGVREALFEDSIPKAITLLKKMQGPNSSMYQPLGDLLIHQTIDGEIKGYRRELNISNAIATTQFNTNETKYLREIFSSAKDQIIVIRLTSSVKGRLNFSINSKHDLKYRKTINNKQELILKGKARISADDRRNPKPVIYKDSSHCNGMRFEWRVKVIANDGTLTSDSLLHISNASDVVLIISCATSFNGYDKCPDKDGKDESAEVQRYLDNVSNKNFVSLRDDHITDYKKYFDRVSFSNTNQSQTTPQLPTDERLEFYKKGMSDSELEVLYFQFGRYLLISSSRPGGVPANLQGIWNPLLRPSWRSNYTTNINLQMNYWLAEPANLTELTDPLICQIKRLSVNGAVTAKNYYNMRGWVVHHNSDIWGMTNPAGEGNGDPKWANWSLGSAWLSQHLFEHYQFTRDLQYLKNTAYPLMKSASEFCIDWLIEKDNQLVTAPSTSPENIYLHPKGYKGTVTIASAMDMEIVWDLFTNTIEAANILGVDKGFVSLLENKRAKLSPLKIGSKGNLVEWFGDWEDVNPKHRHVSHLFGLFPGRQISPLANKHLADACRRTLEKRGDEGTGWSKAWKINFWARLFDGDHAYKMYQELLRNSTLHNLFDNHPPFQIDGNFGAVSGIIEMLLQSHLNEIHLLPALPQTWKDGHIKGLIARGNFEVEIYWQDSKLTKSIITSRSGGVCKIRSLQEISIAKTNSKSVTQKMGDTTCYLTTFQTKSGQTYSLDAHE